MKRSPHFCPLICALSLCAAFSATATTPTYTLNNGNASVTIKAGVGLSDPDFGMNSWKVDGMDQLYRQWFWFRTGSGGKEKTISQLALEVPCNQASDNYLTTLYRNDGKFTIGVNYTLLGGAAGSGSSTIGEQIIVKNISGSALDFHFFQYVDFDLGGSSSGDTLELGQDASGLFNSAFQHKGTSYFADEFLTPGANHGQAALASPVFTLFYSLTDNSPTTLNNFAGPITGDTSWAFQWDVTIPVNGTFNISLNKSVYVSAVPEPTVLAFAGLSCAIFAGVRRSRFNR